MLICANDALDVEHYNTDTYFLTEYTTSVSVCTAYCDAYQLHENSGVVMYNTWIRGYLGIVPYVEYEILTSLLQASSNVTKTAPIYSILTESGYNFGYACRAKFTVQ